MALRLSAMDRHYLRFSRIIYQLRAEAGVSGSWAEAGVVDIYHELALPIINDLRLAAEKGLIREVDFELAACSWIGAADIVLFRKNLDRKYSSEEVINPMVDSFFEGHSSDGRWRCQKGWHASTVQGSTLIKHISRALLLLLSTIRCILFI